MFNGPRIFHFFLLHFICQQEYYSIMFEVDINNSELNQELFVVQNM